MIYRFSSERNLVKKDKAVIMIYCGFAENQLISKAFQRNFP